MAVFDAHILRIYTGALRTKKCVLVETLSHPYALKMQIAVLGVGNVGGALWRLWSEAGHQVTTAGAPGSPIAAEVAGRAEVITLCVPGGFG